MSSTTRTIREQVTDQIRDDLIAGHIAVGEALRESELADRFGVSRGPIRDAFLQLANEGFLDYQANRGVTLHHPPDSENRAFIVSLRKQIELFVVNQGMNQLNGNTMADIKKALVELKRACAGKDAPAVARCDMAFHEAILIGCDGGDFILAWKQLCAKLLLTYTPLTDYQEGYEEHAQIFEALRSGDKSALIAALETNIG